jgi:sugar phosphate isomerase/epimerase
VKLGLFTDAFPKLSLIEVMDWLRREVPTISRIEIGTGAYSPAPHCDMRSLLRGGRRRKAWLDSIRSRGYEISALNVSGNPLSPRPDVARRHDRDLRDTIRLAAQLGVDRVVAMSGCPAGPGRGRADAPHFAAGAWLPDLEHVADWQWETKVRPYWEQMVTFAHREYPELQICFELHPGTYVYNVPTFRLVEALGSNLAVNLDPSHFFWQSMDPLVIIGALGAKIGHAHGKDTRMLPENLALTGVLDNRWLGEPMEMPWLFATVGDGRPAEWWNRFVQALAGEGFDGTVSLEYEDPLVDAETSVKRSAALLAEAMQVPAQA